MLAESSLVCMLFSTTETKVSISLKTQSSVGSQPPPPPLLQKNDAGFWNRQMSSNKSTLDLQLKDKATWHKTNLRLNIILLLLLSTLRSS